MAKKKKKNINQLNKQEFAHHRNEYLKGLKNALKLMGCPDAFALIPRSDYNRIYQFRATNVPVDKAGGKGITNGELAFFKVIIKRRLYDTETLNIIYKEKALTIHYVLAYIMALKLYSRYLGFEESANAKKIKEILDEKIEYNKILIEALEKITFDLLIDGVFHSRFDQEYFWFEIKHEIAIKEHSTQLLKIVLNKEKAVKRSLEVDGNIRTIFKVATPTNKGLRWASLKGGQFNNGTKDDKQYDIYIQSHAIRRFYERLDCLEDLILNYSLIEAFLQPEIIHFKNTYLIEFNLYGHKVGYFMVEQLKEIALVRTFLFITNNGTPEGQKLEQICGLKKHDKAYWNIDKLSTFKNSDIAENPELRKIFVEAGCKDVFEVNLKEAMINEKQIEQAAQLIRYLKTEEKYELEIE